MLLGGVVQGKSFSVHPLEQVLGVLLLEMSLQRMSTATGGTGSGSVNNAENLWRTS